MIKAYQNFLDQANEKATLFKRQGNRIALFRFVAFLALCGSAYKNWSGESVFIWIGLIALAGFISLIKLHKRIVDKRKLHETLSAINQEEFLRIKGDLSPFDNGEEFIQDKHPNTSDLDILGDRSLFQYINRCSTQEGKEQLAELMTEQKKSQIKINSLQEGVKELRDQSEWRQTLHAYGRMQNDLDAAMSRVKTWVSESNQTLEKLKIFLSFFVPALFAIVGVLYLVISHPTYEIVLFVLVAVNMALMGTYVKRIQRELRSSGQMSKAMTNCSHILKHIKEQSFQSEVIKSHQASIGSESIQAIKELSQIMGRLESLHNAFGVLLMSGTFQYHVHAYHALIKWKSKHASNSTEWFRSIGAMEALASVANFSFNNLDYAYPSFNKEGTFEFKSLGHPLLPADIRISNDVSFSQGQLVILTGSNMSGKSTFLRTVGINLILAKCGAPVCAASANIDSLNVYVHMKVADSLAGGQSYFFAEVDRLRFIKENLEREKGFVLLDEILRGTNSEDKQTGTIEFLKKLRSLGTTGVVATHDLSVCDLSEEFPDTMSTKCFEVEMNQEELTFDYRLREGICQNKNASVILRKFGII